MATKAIAGVGTKFQRSTTSAGTFEDIAEVLSIDGPGMSRENIDVTNLDSAGGYREYIPGFRDGGTISLSMNFTKETYATMFGDYESDEKRFYKIVLPAANGTISFEGFVTECPLSISPDSQITADVTIQISGKPTVAFV